MDVVVFPSTNGGEWKGRFIQKFMRHKDVNGMITQIYVL